MHVKGPIPISQEEAAIGEEGKVGGHKAVAPPDLLGLRILVFSVDSRLHRRPFLPDGLSLQVQFGERLSLLVSAHVEELLVALLTDFDAVAAFQQETSELIRQASGAAGQMSDARERLTLMRAALVRTPGASPELFTRMDRVAAELNALSTRLNGDPVRGSLNEASAPSIRGRLGTVSNGHWETRQTPTETQRANVSIAQDEFEALSSELNALLDGELAQLEQDLVDAGAPWTPGRRVPSR